MDVRAILLVGGRYESSPADGTPLERVAGRPICLLDVLGRPVLHHLIERLHRAGIEGITVVSDSTPRAPRAERDAIRGDVRWLKVSEEQFWRTAENTFAEYASGGAEHVLVVRLGAWADVDFRGLLDFHAGERARVTQVCDEQGAIETFVISASRRNDAAFMLRNRLLRFRAPCTEYLFTGYCNRLANGGDLRRLASDGLLQRAGISPAAREVRPGIWVHDTARVDRDARLVAPVFVGAWARVRAGVLITRCASVEHHTEVDCGTAVENATVLPYSYVGPGLEVANCVLGFRQIEHLKQKTVVEIGDPKLVSEVSQSVSWRALKQTAALVSYLPAQFMRGLFQREHRDGAALPEVNPRPESALAAPRAVGADCDAPTYNAELPAGPQPAELSRDLAVVRRYADQ